MHSSNKAGIIWKKGETIDPGELQELASKRYRLPRESNFANAITKDGVKRSNVSAMNSKKPTLRPKPMIDLWRSVRHWRLARRRAEIGPYDLDHSVSLEQSPLFSPSPLFLVSRPRLNQALRFCNYRKLFR
jgi:hypothetical protein